MANGNGTSIDVLEIIDRPRLGRLQITVVALCGIAAVLDGFDILAIAFAAPSIAQKLKFDISSFGAVFGIASFGLMAGSLVFGSAADRIGRKPMIILAMLIVGLFSLLTPFARSFIELMVVRFLAGLGIGALMPNIITLTAEYSPGRWRATIVTVMFSGVTVGAILAGLLSAAIVGRWGWQTVFYIGGIFPFMMAPLFLLFLPESLGFLIVRRAAPAKALAILRRLDPSGTYDDGARLALPEATEAGGKTSLSGLFAHDRAWTTPLLWLIFFCNLLMWFFLTNWLPIVLQEAGFPRERAALATVVLYTGGLVGGLALGWMVDKGMSFGRLALVYLIAAGCVISVAMTAGTGNPFLHIAIFCAGFFVGGAQYAINAIAANVYPTEMRSTGIGWALGVGRLGSISGPSLGGILMAANWGTDQIIGLFGLPALLAMLAAFIIGWNLRRQTNGFEVSESQPNEGALQSL